VLTQDKLLLIGRTALSGIYGTIRYYEGLGLLKSSGRTEEASDSFHRYLPVFCSSSGLKALALKVESSLRFTIKKTYRARELKKLEDKLLEIDRQIQQLLILQTELKGLLSSWKSFQPNSWHNLSHYPGTEVQWSRRLLSSLFV